MMMLACSKPHTSARVSDLKQFSRSIQLPLKPSFLSDARRFMVDVAEETGFGEDAVFEIVTAVNEACANAIVHGARGARAGSIWLKAYANKDSLIVMVTGKSSFGKKSARQSFDTDNGRGLCLMSALMDRVTISVGEGVTRVVMTKHR